MKLETMEQEIAKTTRPTIKAVELILSPYSGTKISASLWVSLMRLLFLEVEPASVKAGDIARNFYDAERSRVFPDAPRNDVYRATLTFEQFLEDMQDVYPLFARKYSVPEDIHRAALRATRSIENTARWTVINAVNAPDPYLDDGPNVTFEESEDEFEVTYATEEERNQERMQKGIRTWARVATGAETCGWCIMLCSRGPVYGSAEKAGSIRAWHDGCDCKVVPVFDTQNWKGRERFLAADRMYRRVADDYDLRGKDVINAMRRAANRGDFKKFLSEVESE